MVKKLQQFGKIINLFNNSDNYYFENDIFFSNYLSFSLNIKLNFI